MTPDAAPSSAGPWNGTHDFTRDSEQQSHLESDFFSPRSAEKDDPDTCRICRGESSSDEPLFYPCKCSGSIKYVHQECLMEWLSHSQKKYCELCKTPFRFTKLYHPGMPTRIPTTVFVRRAAIHVLKMFMTWCRALLVASVWLVLLPWCMRVVWRSLFWVGDGGWSHDLYPDPTPPKDIPPGSANIDFSRSKSINLDAVRSAVASAVAANNTKINITLPQNQKLTAWTLMKRFFFGVPYPLSHLPIPGRNTTDLNSTADPLGMRNPSLLSEISFFKWFPSQAANRFLIDVLEGQIITLLVVVAFILIFLIREWVVQQQPVINMVALGGDAANGVGVNDNGQAAEIVVEEEEDDDDEDEEPHDNPHNPVHEGAAGGNEEERQQRPDVRVRRSSSARRKRQAIFRTWQDSEDIPEDLRRAMQDGSADDIARIIERMPIEDSIRLKEHLIRLSERISRVDDTESGEDMPGDIPSTANASEKHAEEEQQASSSSYAVYPERSTSLPQSSTVVPGPSDLEPPTYLQRPNMPARDRSFIATEIRRSLEEGNSWSFAAVPKPSEEEPEAGENIPDSWEEETGDKLPNKEHNVAASDQDQEHEHEHEQTSEHSSESWQQVPDIVLDDSSDQALEGEHSKGKGKAKVSDEESIVPHGEGTSVPIEEDDKEKQPGMTDAGFRIHTAPDSNAVSSGPSESAFDSDSDSDLDSIKNNPSLGGEEQHASDAEPNPEAVQEPGVEVEQEPEAEQEPAPAQIAQPAPHLMDRILDWVFGDVAPGVHAAEDNADDEAIVRNLAEEAPFVPFAANEPEDPINAAMQDPEVAAAAAEAGIDVNDQDAIDDAEDLEGIMELIGMQGPLTGLFQNAMFSAVLISATLACAVWLPYLWGKVVILFMGSPLSLFVKLPLQILATLTDLFVDTALFVVAGATCWSLQLVYMLVKVCSWGTLSPVFERPIGAISTPAQTIAESAMDRLSRLVLESPLLPRPDYFRLSINSHAALRHIQNSTSYALNQTSNLVAAVYDDVAADSFSANVFRAVCQSPRWLQNLSMFAVQKTSSLFSWFFSLRSYKITFDLDLGQNATTSTASLANWTAGDRLIAIFAGYAFFAMAGAVYLKRGTPFSTSQQGQKVERIISDILQQAGGVLKVILIISIEMLAFPLYCGLLLDLALLPLFQNATIYSRWQFTRDSPWTSGFVHWFIGTCYMFHFALFVSMCRKIMRKGVLYFIRNPDDPTFHPVRDVLERSITTQLRKIAFSALVYGALVVVCLGGVVWGLSRATSNVLPIHWASKAPSLEFPLDLLFYNFLTPVIIKLYKPSEGLHAVSQWWFKKCARVLRLSNFLFGDKVKEEEGHHVRRTWSSWFAGEKGDPEAPIISEEEKKAAEGKDETYFVFDGRYVRAPASDQARIPKGETVFVEVDRDNKRKDGKSEEGGVHNSEMVTMVYIPPWFRLRIALFVFTIWVFAAVSGVSVTILPLLLGRHLFSLFLPASVEMNDIHAFSLGIYTLGTLAYSGYQLYKFLSSLDHPVPNAVSTLHTIIATSSRIGLHVIRFIYVWSTLIFVIPFLFAVLIELYFLMPLHAYLGPKEPHVVHLIQDWTLGFLYARLAARLVFANRASRPARAFSAVVRDGYLNPNARIATRCFLLPVLVIFAISITIPASFAFVMNRTVYIGADETIKSQVWRFSFPSLGLSFVAMWLGREAINMVTRWRMVVRDEVYLIGERLHNFGDRKSPPAQAEAAAGNAIVI